MKKYLIKTTSTGTPNNPNFAGVSNVCYSAKGSLTHFDRDVYPKDVREGFLPNALKRLARDYGYVSESSAKCGLASLKKVHNDEANRFSYHTFEHEIICVEI